MTVILVDNNSNNLSRLSDEIVKIFPEWQIELFSDPLMSAKYVCNNKVDLAFLAAEMDPVDGYILQRTLRANKPDLSVIMFSGSAKHRKTSLTEAVDAYLVEPVSSESLKEAIKQALF